MPNKFVDHIGKRYGKIVVLSYREKVPVPNNEYGHHYYLFDCKCDCGNITILPSYRFRDRKYTLTCGCEHANRQFSREENTYRSHYSYHSKTCNNHKWGALSFGEWKTVVSQCCITCGAAPARKTIPSGDPIFINGVDRIDSSKGYTPDNVQPMCTWCNVAKSSLSTEEFIEKCKQVLSFQSSIKDGTKEEIEEIILLDVKTGKADLNKTQRRIRDAITAGRVSFATYNPDTNDYRRWPQVARKE